MISPRTPTLPMLEEATPEVLRKFRVAVQQALEGKASNTAASQELLLFSPNGSVYAVMVSDDGTLSTQLRSTP